MTLPVACDRTAIAPEARDRWQTVINNLYSLVEDITELPDGYALRLPGGDDVLTLAVEHIAFERLCCPFLRFTLEVEPNHGPTWLRLTGDAEAKEFLRFSLESVNVH